MSSRATPNPTLPGQAEPASQAESGPCPAGDRGRGVAGAAARRKRILAGGVAIYLILVLLFVYGALKQSNQVNTDPHRTDQSAYLNFAGMIVESDWWYGGKRNRMPAYPYLLATLYDANDSLETYFQKSKVFNIGLTLALLHVIGWIAWVSLGPLAGSVTTLIVAFTVLIYRAPFVQAEVLFYALFFTALATSFRLLCRPGIGLAALAGILFALAQLTKASALPGLALLVVCLGVRTLGALFTTAPREGSRNGTRSLKHAGAAVVAVAVFLSVLSPYLINSKRTYGRYFYNVNSTFYMWYDSWEEAKAGTRAHGDRLGWPQMDPASIPSARKYFQEHRAGEMIDRIRMGFTEIHDYSWGRHGFMKYLVIYGIAGLLAFGADRLRAPWPPFKHPAAAAFAAGAVVGYALLAYWVVPLGPGIRVFMGIVLPAIYFLQLGLRRSPSANAPFDLMGRTTCLRDTLNLVLLLCITSELYPLLTERITRIYGGY